MLKAHFQNGNTLSLDARMHEVVPIRGDRHPQWIAATTTDGRAVEINTENINYIETVKE